MINFKVQCDVNAPVFSEASIEINANCNSVMAILANLKNWRKWRSGISDIELLDSRVREGSDFKWASGGIRYKSRIHTLSRTHFGWTGKTLGAYAIHNWYIEKISSSKSKVIVQESLSGWSILLLRKAMTDNLPKMLNKDLQELKFECERSA
jgi:hypothetical protein